jgi:hypothetical protein
MSRYVFVPIEQLTECMVSHTTNQTIDSVRTNLANTEVCIEYSGPKPECLAAYVCKDAHETQKIIRNGSYGLSFPFL